MVNDSKNLNTLADRLAACIAEADAAGLHVVAAHLDTALCVLQGSGRAAPENERHDQPLH